MRVTGIVTLVATVLMCLGGIAQAQEYSIFEIQHTTDPDGNSPLVDQVVDCVGGIVVAKNPGYKGRVFLQDPARRRSWGGIVVKDWEDGELFDNVEIGDWVSLDNVGVEEYRGNTLLQYNKGWYPDVSFTVESQGNTLPRIVTVPMFKIPAPVYSPDDGGWYVENHRAERYESMRIRVWFVTVTDLDLGKADDCYNLQNWWGRNTWVTDYMNEDLEPPNLYHEYVILGQRFWTISGVFEQYTKLSSGWDYYQLCTLFTSDLVRRCGSSGLKVAPLSAELKMEAASTMRAEAAQTVLELQALDSEEATTAVVKEQLRAPKD